MKLQHWLIALNRAETRRFGVPGRKQPMNWLDFYVDLSRNPLLDLHEQEKPALKTSFHCVVLSKIQILQLACI